MIALCREHADKADNGAFTDDQLRELKRVGKERASLVRGRFDWMRQDLLAVIGGNFYYQQDDIFRINETRCIWFDRDEENYLLLNFRMPTSTGLPRAAIEQNFWTVPPEVDEIVCPPSGRLVEVSYSNGDRFRAEFFDIESPDALVSRYPAAAIHLHSGGFEFPLTAVELWETAIGTSIEFGPTFSKLGGLQFSGTLFERNPRGVGCPISPDELVLLFPEEGKTYIDSDVILTDLIDRSLNPPGIVGLTFTRCQIRGPIVVRPVGMNVFTECRFQGPQEQILLEIPEDAINVGASLLRACRFTNCDIEGMGILGTSEHLEALRSLPKG